MISKRFILLTLIAVCLVIGVIAFIPRPDSQTPTTDSVTHSGTDMTSGSLGSMTTTTGSETTTGDHDQEKEHIVIPPTPSIVYSPKNFVDMKTSEASCTAVQIRDDKDRAIAVPAEIREILECIGGSESISPNYRFLTYSHTNPSTNYIDIKLYDFVTEKTQTLMSLNPGIDGMSCLWHDNNRQIACTVINQRDYVGKTKIFILSIDAEGKLTQKQNFPQTAEDTVQFVCASSCYPGDVWFEGENGLFYEGYYGYEDSSVAKIHTIIYQ